MANKERIKEWVDALRSGRYTQTTSALKNEQGYCCLGVACEVAGIESVPTDAPSKTYYSYGYYEDELPHEAVEYYDLEEHDPRLDIPEKYFDKYDGDNTNAYATILNDSYCFTFDEIADCIELTYLQE